MNNQILGDTILIFDDIKKNENPQVSLTPSIDFWKF